MKRPFLIKVRELCASWEDAPKTPLPEQPEEVDGLEVLFQRLEEMPYRKVDSPTGRLTELTELMNDFSLEELADFFTALLLEDPELMSLPLFPDTLHVSKSEASYDWLMNLPYTTMAKARSIFESLFEGALDGAYGPEGSVAALQKIKALTAKNRAGLPFEYLERKVRSGGLAPALRLELAQLMVLHEDYDLDFSAAESLFSVQRTPYMLPALMEAYLRAGLEGAKQALRALNQFKEKDFPVRAVELMPGMIYMLEEVARSFRKAFPADWQKRLNRFVHEELEIANSWLRELVAEELGVSLQMGEGIKQEVQVAYSVETKEAIMVAPEAITFKDELSPEMIRSWIGAAMQDEKRKGLLFRGVAQDLKRYAEVAARNARPLLVQLKRDTDIEVENVFEQMGIEVSLDPYMVRAPFMWSYTEGAVNLKEKPNWKTHLKEVFRKADNYKRQLIGN
ncbi:MAG: hypothetical protein H6573_05335 [Lewinellaceae bacterium]|nr:hypothetical protein [Phaeodactylibacter sp.]MCB9346924.1 hypothetical protein [Lewinellaceae bacterium]